MSNKKKWFFFVCMWIFLWDNYRKKTLNAFKRIAQVRRTQSSVAVLCNVSNAPGQVIVIELYKDEMAISNRSDSVASYLVGGTNFSLQHISFLSESSESVTKQRIPLQYNQVAWRAPFYLLTGLQIFRNSPSELPHLLCNNQTLVSPN